MNDFIAHFGIQGMKWGVRRYQNPDGTLTFEGQQRYYKSSHNEKTDRTTYGLNKKGEKRYLDKNGNYNELAKKERPYAYREYRAKKAVDEVIKSKDADRQKEFLKRMNDSSGIDDDAADEYAELEWLIKEKSGDWYHSTSVSEANRKAFEKEKKLKDDFGLLDLDFAERVNFDYKRYKEMSSADPEYVKLKAAYEKAVSDSNGVVLKDIGFEDTKEARKLIHNIIRWD